MTDNRDVVPLVPLFARRLTIRRQNTINERRSTTTQNAASRSWAACSNSRYRPDTKFMLSTKLLEQFHFGSPVHARPPDLLGRP